MTTTSRRALWEGAAAAYLGGIAWLAQITAFPYFLFPELGALAHDILTRPRGTWARAPLLLVITPLLTAAVGTYVARHWAYGPVAVLLIVGIAILVIRALRSPIAPAISAGLLPLALGEKSWWYPPAILLGTGLLAAIAFARLRWFSPPPAPESAANTLDDILERPPRDWSWVAFYLVFLTVGATVSELLDWHFLLYPPLAVIGFEMFAHTRVCPWANRPLALPVACASTAAIGLAIVEHFGAGPLAAAGATLCGIGVLRLLRLHAPPAVAVGLLPFVIEGPDFRFPIAVAAGTSLLVGTFLLWRVLSSPAAARRES